MTYSVLKNRYGEVIDVQGEKPKAEYQEGHYEVKLRVHEGKWKTKDGDVLLISEMETVHILRTISMIMRKRDQNHPINVEYIRLFRRELHKRDPNAFNPP